MTQSYSGGEFGYVGIADEYDPLTLTGAPGTFVAPTQFLKAESDTLDANVPTIKRDTYGGGRDSTTGYRTGKGDNTGAVTLALYPKNGNLLLAKALGKKITRSAITADTTTGPGVATGGSTVYTLTAGGAWAPGDIAFFGTSGSASYEPLPVLAYNSGTKAMTVPTPLNTHATGTTVTRVSHDQYMPYTQTDGIGSTLGTISVEQNIGGKYSQRYPNTMVGRWVAAATAAKIDITADLHGSSTRVLANGVGGNPSPTAYNYSDPTLNDLGFEFSDGFLCFPADPTDSGTAALQLVSDGQDWSVEINNNIKAEACNDRTYTMRHFAMKRDVLVKFKMLNGASRPVAFNDFFMQNLDVPWFSFSALNIGTPAVPVWQVIVFYAPNLRLTKAAPVHGLTDIVGEQIDAEARRVGSQEKLYVSVYAP